MFLLTYVSKEQKLLKWTKIYFSEKQLRGLDQKMFRKKLYAEELKNGAKSENMFITHCGELLCFFSTLINIFSKNLFAII
jgi:hypothetical protein